MSTCFIFFDAAHHTPDADLPEHLWAARLDDSGEVDVALSEHTPEAIQAMQEGARTVIVLPASIASIHLLDLPKLSARKAREAIPYALEDALAEPVQEVHVAFDRDEANPLTYRVVALNKLRLGTWVSTLEALGLKFDVMTLDWFALAQGDLCVTDTDLLVHATVEEDAVNGALSPLLAKAYLKTQAADDISGFLFDDSVASLQLPGVDKQTGSYRLFIANRLLNTTLLNICQGDFQRTTQKRGRTYWYALCGGLLGIWFLSVLGVNAFLLHQLHRKQAVVDADIETIYHGFFPEAAQVISPRFRIERLLKDNTSDEASSFWLLLNKLSKVFLKHPLQMEHIQFRDQVISVSLVAENFAEREVFEQQLKNEQVVVKQIEASTRENQVISTLELQL